MDLINVRVPAVALVMLVIVSVLVGCGEATSGGSGQEITWQVWADPEEAQVYETMIDAYAVDSGDASIQLNAIPDRGTFMSKLSASFAGGTPPDVFLINYRFIGQFAGKDVLEPLGPRLAESDVLSPDDYYGVPMNAFTIDSELQCIPFNQSSLVVYYNVDLFNEYGVPLPTADWTWDDFLAAAHALTRDTDGDGETDLWGLGFEPTIIRAAPFIWSHGGSIQPDPENASDLSFTSPETREALQFFVDLNLVHGVVPPEAQYAAQDPDSRFMEGSIAMTLNSRRATPVFRSIEEFTWDVAPPPADVTQTSTLHSDAFCIPAEAEHPEEAWRFVEWAVGQEGQAVAAELGRTVPSLKAVAESDSFLDPGKLPANGQVFIDLGPRLVALPTIAEWPEIERAINEELYVAFFGKKPLDEALETAERIARDAVSR